MAQYSPVLPDTVTTALYQQAASIALHRHHQLQRARATTATTTAATLHSAGHDTVLSVLRIAAVLTCTGHVTQVSFNIMCSYSLLPAAVQPSDNSAQHSVYRVTHAYSYNTSGSFGVSSASSAQQLAVIQNWSVPAAAELHCSCLSACSSRYRCAD
eukprot:10711-Heterococcus_DN1.PRE.1